MATASFPSDSDIEARWLESLIHTTLAEATKATPAEVLAVRTFFEILARHGCHLVSSTASDGGRTVLQRYVDQLLQALCTVAAANSTWPLTASPRRTEGSELVVEDGGELSNACAAVHLSPVLVASVYAWLVAALHNDTQAHAAAAVDVAVRKLSIALDILTSSPLSVLRPPSSSLSSLVRYVWYGDTAPRPSPNTLTSIPTPTEVGGTLQGRPRVLLLCTGSVACIKVPLLLRQLAQDSVAGACAPSFGPAAVVATNAAMYFLRTLTETNSVTKRIEPVLREVRSIEVAGLVHRSIDGVPVYTDADEWLRWQRVGDEVLHIELRKQFDVALIAPLDANTLGKLACGLSDNLVTCVMRAWSVAESKNPIVLAPAMNTVMWDHPLTKQHLQTLMGDESRAGALYANAVLVEPISKVLACGDVGKGAMASVDDIVRAVQQSSAHLVP